MSGEIDRWHKMANCPGSGCVVLRVLEEQAGNLEYQDIIRRCLKGDRKAQKTLFEHFAPKMLYLCRRYAIDAHEAEDMVQEGFVRLFTHLDKFRNTGPFEGWVRRIFVNAAIRYYHREQRHHDVGETDALASSSAADLDALQRMSEQEIIGLLTALPEGYRVVFNLYAIEGYSHAEIAGMLQIQESTSRSQLVKARKMLQARILNLQTIAI